MSDLLDKEVGLPKDARELFLTRADYHLKTDDHAQAIAQLERAVPLVPQKMSAAARASCWRSSIRRPATLRRPTRS